MIARLSSLIVPPCLRRWAAGLALVVFALALSGCESEPSGETQGLLAKARPTASPGVSQPELVTDGLVPPEGSPWKSNRTSIFSSRSSFIQWDLGEPTPIRAAAVLADNNDDYVLEGSDDGQSFRTLWTARSVRGVGLRWRTTQQLDGSARFVRLKPGQGDHGMSVAELAVFAEAGASLPPRLVEKRGIDLGLHYRNALVLLAAALFVALLLSAREQPLIINGVVAAIGLAGVSYAVSAFVEARPVDNLEVSLTRGIAATLAGAVVVREAFSPRNFRPLPWVTLPILTLAAVMAVGSFFNLGKPQFFDHAQGEPSVVHNYDMRVYYPVAKYFDELRYDGLYLASVLSYAEEHGGIESRRIQNTELRDLRDHRMRKVKDIQPEVEAIRRRFSDARWAEFKKDMSYFWRTMGAGGYLGSMSDHGGNATPVWLSIAHLMFKSAPASNTTLLWSGLLDPLLLLIFAVAVWRSFGVRTALVSLVVFGANDFYMFGSNWAGATLRNDWMVYLGLGACALKTKRFRLGGALLALSALIRAFPAITLLALGVPIAYALVRAYRQGRRPSWREFVRQERWFFDTALGATTCVVVAVGFSSLVLGPESWPQWVAKISSFTASPHVNHVSLLTVIAGSEGNQAMVLESRLPAFVAATAVYVALAVWASYRRPAHVVALLGIALMPVFMYPANYYIHFIFLLPLLVDEPLGLSKRVARHASGRVWVILLGLCAAQYFTVREDDLDVHFYNASVLLMGALLLLLAALLPRDENGDIRVPAWVGAGPARPESALGREPRVETNGDASHPPVDGSRPADGSR